MLTNLKLVGQLQMSIKQINWHQIPKMIAKLEKPRKQPWLNLNPQILKGVVIAMGLLMIFFVPKDNHNARLLSHYKDNQEPQNQMIFASHVEDMDIGGKIVKRSKQEEIAASPIRDSRTSTPPISTRRSSSKEISTKCNRETSSNRPKGKSKNKYVNEFKVKYDNSFIDTNLQAFLEENEQSIVNSVNYESNFAEFEKGESEIIVKGRLKKNLEYWKGIGANKFILDTIESGYKIPFIETPKPAEFPNNRSAKSFAKL